MTWRINITSLPWADGEVIWHSYNLRAMLTYDDYLQEHALNQAGEYLYNTLGFQGAARDSTQGSSSCCNCGHFRKEALDEELLESPPRSIASLLRPSPYATLCLLFTCGIGKRSCARVE